MRICFKEVGQGDSIILEWKEGEQKKVAIIDANLKKDKSNPTLNYLIGEGFTSIEFLMLTHPHTDHFSGISDILDYCNGERITIKKFLHTSSTIPQCLLASVTGDVALSELERLFTTVEQLQDSGIIQEVFYISNGSKDIALGGDWKISFLGPSSRSISMFNNSKYKGTTFINEEPGLLFSENNTAANWLSTLLKIHNAKGHYALLTSDTVKRVFRWVVRDGMVDFRAILLAAQLPHHGAFSNYHETFFRQLRYIPNTKAVVSVGENNYGHPSPPVLTSMKNLAYDVHFTNREQASVSKSAVKNSSFMDMISVKETPRRSKNFTSRDIWIDLEALSQKMASQ